MTKGHKKSLEMTMEARRQKVLSKIEKTLGKEIGYGLVPIADGVRAVADDIKAGKIQKARALDSDYRAGVKQITDFAFGQKVEHSGSVNTTAFTPGELEKHRQEAALAFAETGVGEEDWPDSEVPTSE